MKTLPSLLYGTAWKQDRTQHLVKQALLLGFRAIDTAAQPKHYQEHLVGAGIREALHYSNGRIRREDVYIQTKYTSVHGQDLTKPLPYDPADSITAQVHASVASSLHNLRHSDEGADKPNYLDCLVLHSPFPTTAQTLEAWQAMESHVPLEVRTLGLSNCDDVHVLHALWEAATVKPSVLQNRFYPGSGYDGSVRHFCQSKGIVYQSFWTLTANPHLLHSSPVAAVGALAQVSNEVALYSLVLGLGHVQVLCGTTNPDRMQEDLTGITKVQSWSAAHAEQWNHVVLSFDSLLK